MSLRSIAVALVFLVYIGTQTVHAATDDADGGGSPGGGALILTVDDTGGSQDLWNLSFNGVASLIADAQFSLTDETTGFVSDGTHSPDWNNLTAIAAGPDVGDYATTVSKWDNTALTYSGVQVEQFTFANATSANAYVIVVFKVTATAAGNVMLPTLWANFDVGGTAVDDDETEYYTTAAGAEVIRHFETSTGTDAELGLVLLSGVPQNIAYETTFPANDAAEEAIVTANTIDPDTAGTPPPTDFFTAMTAPDMNMTTIGNTAVVAYAIVAGVSQAALDTAADAAYDAWNTDAQVTGWTGTLKDVVNGSVSTSGLLVDSGGFPGPVIDSITPANGALGGGTSMAIGGILLTSLTGVSFGSGAATPVVVGGTDLARTLVTESSPAAGVVDLMFESTQGDTEITSGFTYDLCATAPTIDSIDEDEGLFGDDIVITGTGFLCDSYDNMEVLFDSVAGIIDSPITSDTQLTVSAPAGTAGETVDITVSNLVGTDTLVNAFTYASTGDDDDEEVETPESVLFGQNAGCALTENSSAPGSIAAIGAVGVFALLRRRRRKNA